MLTVKTLIFNPVGVNCYVAFDETKEAVIIDCGCSTQSEWNELKEYLAAENLQVKHLLNTHLHFDHVWGNPFVYAELGLSPEAHKDDVNIYNNCVKMVEQMFGVRVNIPPMPPLCRMLKDGDTVTFGNTTLQVLHTPGHSMGCLCFYDEKDGVLFSGDTLFCCGMGRTDLEGGNQYMIYQSLQRLALLPDDTKVYCGHGEDTTIAFEKKHNPYL